LHSFEVADYCSNLVRKTVALRFKPSLGGFGAMHAVHVRLVGKLQVDFMFDTPLRMYASRARCFHGLLSIF